MTKSLTELIKLKTWLWQMAHALDNSVLFQFKEHGWPSLEQYWWNAKHKQIATGYSYVTEDINTNIAGWQNLSEKNHQLSCGRQAEDTSMPITI